jgi:acetyltransferase-like isoleucine patch superfamily enzyme
MDVFMEILNGIKNKVKKFIIRGKRETKPTLVKNAFFTKDFPAYEKYDIGCFTYGNPIIMHWGEEATLTIGKFCSIAGDVKIFLGGNHRVDWISTFPFSVLNEYFPESKNILGHPSTKGDVIIGNDVWIGQGTSIMSGVRVGDGAVIGAYSIVTKNVEPYSIIAGNPAKFIKLRFDEHIISELLKISWWNWPIEKVKHEIQYLCNENIDIFIERNLP